MIGNAYSFKDTGFSILEEGDLNPSTMSLDVKCYWVVDRQAQLLQTFASKIDAERFLEAYFSERRQQEQ